MSDTKDSLLLQQADRLKDLADRLAPMTEVLEVQKEIQNELGKTKDEKVQTWKDMIASLDSLKGLPKELDDLKTDLAKRSTIDIGGQIDDKDARNLLNRYVCGVVRAGLNGDKDREYLKGVLGEIEKAGLSSDTGVGSHFAPTILTPQVIRAQAEIATFRNDATVVPMTSDKQDWPSLAAVTLAWQGTQGTASVDQEPVTSNISLATDTLVATVPVNDQLIEDATPDVASALVDAFSEQILIEEEKQALQGTGAGADPFTGVSDAASVNETVMVGAAASTAITLANVTTLISQLISRALGGAKFYASRTVANQLRTLEDTAGNNIFRPATTGFGFEVYGFPIVISDVMPQLAGSGGAVNEIALILGNVKNIILGDRKRVEVKLSEHAQFRNVQTVLRVTERVAITVSVPSYFARLKRAAA